VIIWQGSRKIDTDDPQTLRIGSLPAPNGGLIDVYRDNVSEAYSLAVGSPPAMPPLLSPGSLVPYYGVFNVQNVDGSNTNVKYVAGYTYDQGPADFNTAEVAEFRAALEARAVQAEAIKNIMETILTQLKDNQ